MRTIHIDKYYTSMDSLLEVYDKNSHRLRFCAETINDYYTWKEKLRTKLAQITGISKMKRCKLEPTLIESEQFKDYRRDKIIIQTEKNVWMPVYVLIPSGMGKRERKACVIATHGHYSGGKYSTAGIEGIPSVEDAIERYNYTYGVRFVKEGYIVFCPDARGFGERREWTGQTDDEESFLSSTCAQLNHMAICLGRSLSGMWTWDLMRLIDYIETRSDCDSKRIACAGLSGGGNQTLWLAAMDDRVKCAVVSGYFYGYRDSHLKLSDNCACNYIPHIWEYVDMGDIGALIAPRPLLVESGSDDPLNGERGILNVIEQIEITRSAYKLFDSGDNFFHYIFTGEHKWDGKETYPFVKKHLGS